MTIDIEQMDAIVVQAYGSPAQALSYRSEPVPQPGPGEVLVEVRAAAVNPFDVVIASGKLGTPVPVIPGGDFAGVIVSDGDRVGEEVWGSGWSTGVELGLTRPGTHARYVALPEKVLSRKPARLTMSQSAAVGRSHLAAWHTVINTMQLLPGETILITGGAGMIGQAATEIARWRGATPIVAARRKPDGVEHFIDTTSTDISEAVLELTDGRGADLVLDVVGGELFEPALHSLRFGGRMAATFNNLSRVEFNPGEEIVNKQLHLSGIASLFWDPADIAAIFDQLAALFDHGLLSPPPVKTWPLAQAVEAYETVADGSAGIKQVLLPGGDAA
ncbi:zinc-binding alcohol dehydrogenase family protein [Nocardia sp. NEAU-G5]|uniref:Zinc-binding alcohol dehydrogenase family protein n=1 Tax=Nocardia albiluteola TaxID=2842303 RepID=A0ABS6B5H3_9NOCA|nr:zinc-binding alcohol dehydrogenase family protein [Nocardia albiluteola]MBU3062598.1 zinc-binding alcohol dehydrogenase family protein [Nocardia albiluteola]MBU3065568.1 zinc-binding alcohol dehydrogenase family protein [Nocardia albiluteola]